MLIKKTLHVAGDRVLLPTLWLPTGFFSRLRGMLGRPVLQLSEGMLFLNCRAIHMFFMRQQLDVVFINSDYVITRTVSRLKPYSWCSDSSASHTLELAAGAVVSLGLKSGQQLKVRDK